MKKIWLIIVSLLVVGVCVFGYSKFKEIFSPVHGIIVYSSDKQKLDEKLKNNDRNIAAELTIEGKYNHKSDSLILNEQSAEKLIKIKALNKVSKSFDNHKFKTLKSLSKTPILWSKKNTSYISDDKGKKFSNLSYSYVVLGESSVTSNILVLNEEDYKSFDSPKEYVSVIKEKRPADDALQDYLIKNNQLHNQIFHYKQ